MPPYPAGQGKGRRAVRQRRPGPPNAPEHRAVSEPAALGRAEPQRPAGGGAPEFPRSTTRAALAVDVMAANALILATTLAAASSMSIKSATELLDRFVRVEIAVEVTHRSARRLFGLAGMSPVRATITAGRLRGPRIILAGFDGQELVAVPLKKVPASIRLCGGSVNRGHARCSSRFQPVARAQHDTAVRGLARTRGLGESGTGLQRTRGTAPCGRRGPVLG